MELVKDYMGCSYLDEVYSLWVLCYMRDDIEETLRKDISEEIGLLKPRIIRSLDGQMIGKREWYSHFFSN